MKKLTILLTALLTGLLTTGLRAQFPVYGDLIVYGQADFSKNLMVDSTIMAIYLIIDSVKIADSTVTSAYSGTLVNTTYVDDAIAAYYVFDNGLTETGGNVDLGDFTTHVDIDGAGFNYLFESLSSGYGGGWTLYPTSYFQIYYKTPTEQKSIALGTSTAGIEVVDNIDNLGFVYNADYSSGAGDRWLTDKAYVDNASSSYYTFTNGLTESSGIVTFEGNFTKATQHILGTYTWTILSAASAPANGSYSEWYFNANGFDLYMEEYSGGSWTHRSTMNLFGNGGVGLEARYNSANGERCSYDLVYAEHRFQAYDNSVAGLMECNITPRGIVYDADYSALWITDRYVPDKGWITSNFAPIGKGVTNGDAHDHYGGDGGQIDHIYLSNKGTNSHAQIDSHIANGQSVAGHTFYKTAVLSDPPTDAQLETAMGGDFNKLFLFKSTSTSKVYVAFQIDMNGGDCYYIELTKGL